MNEKTGSLCCSLEVERSAPGIPVDSLRSVSSSSSGYTSLPSMGSINETDSGSYEEQIQVQLQFQHSNKVTMLLENGDLAIMTLPSKSPSSEHM